MTTPDAQTRVALVTGGVRGIGRAIVAALVADGWVGGVHASRQC